MGAVREGQKGRGHVIGFTLGWKTNITFSYILLENTYHQTTSNYKGGWEI